MSRRFLSLAFAASLLALASGPIRADDEEKSDDSAAAEKPEPNWSARLTAVVGDVTVKLPDAQEFAAAKKGESLSDGTVVKTGAKSGAEVALDGDSVIQIQQNSTFEVKALDRKASRFSIPFGTILAKFRHLTSSEKMEMMSKTAVAAVRGTEFGVSSTEEDSRVGVFDEGEVAVTQLDGKQEVLLEPNQESHVKETMAPEPPEPLRYFKLYRAQMKKLRKRLDFIRQEWRKKNTRQREQLRERLKRLKEVK